MFKNFYYSILNTKTFNNLVSNLSVTVKRKTENKFADSTPSPFSYGKTHNGAYAYSSADYIRLWTLPIVQYLRKK